MHEKKGSVQQVHGDVARNLPQIIAAVVACLGCFCSGLVLGYTSPGIPSMRSNGTSHVEITENQASWIGSFTPLGALVGSLLAGIPMQRFGRKATLHYFCSTGFVIGWLLIIFAHAAELMYVGRFVDGISIGLALSCGPIYVVETATTTMRGALGSFPQFLITIGILCVYILGTFLDWVSLATVCCILTSIFIISLFFVPESPRWLLMNGKTIEAKKALRWLRGPSYDVETEMRELEKNVSDIADMHIGIRDMFTSATVKPFVVSLGLMFFQQFSGINGIVFYTVNIFQSAGSSINEYVSTIIVGTIQVFATFLSVMLIEKTGRKLLLGLSDVFMALSLAALGTYFFLDEQGNADSIKWLPLMSVILFIIAFSVGYGPIPWILTAEILPPAVRVATNPIVCAFNWACVFVITKMYLDLQKILHPYGAFYLFTGICVVGTLFTIFFVPETKGKTSEDIHNYFLGRSRGNKYEMQQVTVDVKCSTNGTNGTTLH